MVKLEPRKCLHFGFNRREDIMQGAAERCGSVSNVQGLTDRLLTHESHTAPWLELHTSFLHLA